MDHETTRGLFSEHMEGDLPQERAKEVQDHLDSCAECRAEYEAFLSMFRSVRDLGRVEPPRDMEKTIERRIRARSKGKFFSERRRGLDAQAVPYEIISLVIIAATIGCLYLMTLLYSLQAVAPAP